MKPLTAFEALHPAYRRILVVLGKPFGLGTFLKVSLIAALAEIGCLSLAVSLPMQVVQVVAQFGTLAARSSLPRAASIGMLVGMLIFLGAFTFVYLILAYVFVRFRFVVFDFLVVPTRQVAGAWRRYGRASQRFFWVNLMLMLGLAVVVVATAGPLILHSFRGAMMKPNDRAAALPGFILTFGLIMLLTVAVQAIDSMVRDFVLPSMALEDAGIESAFGRFFRVLGDEPAEVLLYLIVKLAITIVITIAAMLVVVIGLVVLGAILFGVGAALYALLWHLGFPGKALVVIYGAVAGIGFIALYFVSIFAASGVSGLFRSAYGLYFFAGRYPELGNLLEPPLAPELTEPPPQVIPPLTPLSEPPVW